MNLNGAKRPYLVLGAGVSGLAAARALQEKGCAYDLLEAAPDAGGLTRSITVDAFSFDYTGHLLHLARVPAPSGLPFAGLDDDDWKRVERRAAALVGGRLVTAPVQYNLSELPPPLYDAVSASYDARPAPRDPASASFRDFVIGGFGEELAEQFLIPQNEKTMATSLDRLSHDAVKRFFPPPDEARVREGMQRTHENPATYNSQFWYPRHGGIGRLVHGLARGIAPGRLHCLQEVVRIDLERRIAYTRGSHAWPWEDLFTSLPLHALCAMSGDPDLAAWSKQLTHSATVSFNLGLRGPLPAALEGLHWVYVPDRAIPFYRVGVYSNITAGLCPPGRASLYVEVGVPGKELEGLDVHRDIEPRVLQALAGLGWVKPEDIAVKVVHVIRCAYVHHTPARERLLGDIFEKLRAHGVFPIGRYGTWDYISMEDSIFSGIAAVQGVTG